MQQTDYETYVLSTLKSEASRLEQQYPQGNYPCDFKDIESFWHPDLTKEQYIGMIGAYAMMIARANDQNILPSETELANGKKSFDLFVKNNLTYRQILSPLYNARRNVNYPCKLNNEECEQLDAILRKATPQTEVLDTKKWIVRFPRNRKQKGYSTSSAPKDRLVANINFDDNLINRLDDYCSQRKCWYKTLATQEASFRLDTLVIYSVDQFSESDKKELIGIVSPYVRRDIPHRTNTLDGTLIAEGVSSAPELTPDQCKEFIDNYRCSEKEKEDLRKECTHDGELKISLGQYTILQNLSDLMDKFYPEQHMPRKKQTQPNAVVDSFDMYLDKQTDNFVFISKKGSRFLDVFEKLTDVGLNVSDRGVVDGGKRMFVAPNTPENAKIIQELSAQKKKTSRLNLILNALQTNDFVSAKNAKGQEVIAFIPKKGVSRAEALGAVNKLRQLGMDIIAGATDNQNKPVYTTNPNANNQAQKEWMKVLKQYAGRKN